MPNLLDALFGKRPRADFETHPNAGDADPTARRWGEAAPSRLVEVPLGAALTDMPQGFAGGYLQFLGSFDANGVQNGIGDNGRAVGVRLNNASSRRIGMYPGMVLTGPFERFFVTVSVTYGGTGVTGHVLLFSVSDIQPAAGLVRYRGLEGPAVVPYGAGNTILGQSGSRLGVNVRDASTDAQVLTVDSAGRASVDVEGVGAGGLVNTSISVPNTGVLTDLLAASAVSGSQPQYEGWIQIPSALTTATLNIDWQRAGAWQTLLTAVPAAAGIVRFAFRGPNDGNVRVQLEHNSGGAVDVEVNIRRSAVAIGYADFITVP